MHKLSGIDREQHICPKVDPYMVNEKNIHKHRKNYKKKMATTTAAPLLVDKKNNKIQV